jgi:hypothetical protein
MKPDRYHPEWIERLKQRQEARWRYRLEEMRAQAEHDAAMRRIANARRPPVKWTVA